MQAAEVAEESSALVDLTETQLTRWRRVEECRRRGRKVGNATDMEIHPLWKLPTVRHAYCAANWVFERFPNDRAAARWYVGERA